MWIVSWDPFLMKKLLKSKVCGTREQCTVALFTTELVKSCGLEKKNKNKKEKKKKKKKGENALKSQTWTRTCVQTLSKLNSKNDIRVEGIFHPLTLWDSWKLRKVCLELTSLIREFEDEKVWVIPRNCYICLVFMSLWVCLDWAYCYWNWKLKTKSIIIK